MHGKEKKAFFPVRIRSHSSKFKGLFSNLKNSNEKVSHEETCTSEMSPTRPTKGDEKHVC